MPPTSTPATLSSVVSNLVRAQMGTSVSSTVTDDDLDRHIAEMILKEAKQKAEKYGTEGVKAYLPQSTWWVMVALENSLCEYGAHVGHCWQVRE